MSLELSNVGNIPVTVGNVNVNNTSNLVVSSYDTNKVYDGTSELRMKYAKIVSLNSGNTMVASAVSNKRIRVVSVMLMAKQATTILWQSDSSSATDLTGVGFLAGSSGYVLPFNPNGWFQTGTSLLLNLSSSVATTMGGCITYLETS